MTVNDAMSDVGDAAVSSEAALSSEAAKVYDRQIRLWGLEAQKRITESKVLIVGVTAMHVELSKNLFLAGVRLGILDDAIIDRHHLSYNYLITPDDIGKTMSTAVCVRLMELNPLAKAKALANDHLKELKKFCMSDDVSDCLSQGPIERIIRPYSVVVMSQGVIPLDRQVKLDELCRRHNKGFMSTLSCGPYGIAFCDFHNFTPLCRKEKRLSIHDECGVDDAIKGPHEDAERHVSDIIEHPERHVSDIIEHPERHVSDIIEHPERHVSDIIEHPERHVSDIIEHPERHVSAVVEHPERHVSEVVEYPALCECLEISLGSINLRRTENCLIAFLAMFQHMEEIGQDVIPQDAQRQEINKMMTTLKSLYGITCIPTAAVIGGVLAQEATKFVTRQGDPLCNFIVYNGHTSSVTYARVPVKSTTLRI